MQSQKSVEAKPPIIWPNMILFVTTFLGALIVVPLYGYFVGFDAFEWSFFGIMLAFTGMSITGGYHRLWAHKAYKAHFLLRAFYAIFGAAALQHSVFVWASDHRRHHQNVDVVGKDPYSIRKGFWYAHIGWMVRHWPTNAIDFSNIKDLQKDAILRFQHQYYFQIVLLMNVAFPAFIGWLHGDVIAGLLMGGLLRLVMMHHFTFFINSLAHMWGRRPYTDTNSARDNDLLALVTWGEGYHNYHHYFQWDFRNGIKWWQFDPTKWLILASYYVGLASDLKRVPEEKIEKAIIDMQFKNAAKTLKNKSTSYETDIKMLENLYEDLISSINEWSSFKARWCHVTRQELLASWESSQLFKRYLELKSAVESHRYQWQQLRTQW